MIARLRRLILVCLWVLLTSACSDPSGDWGLDQQGQKFDANALKGRWVLVNYWAEWCGPCRKEIPELNRLSAEGKLRVVGINFDALQKSALADAVRRLGIEFAVASKDPSAALDWPKPQGLPQSYLLDPQGRLRSVLKGEQSMESILLEWNALQQ